VGEHVHDCVIVGAGPAGSAAALRMARDGLDVVLLERGNAPGEKNVMSGVLVTHVLARLVPDFRDRAPLQRCITGGYGLHILGENEVLSLPGLRRFDPEAHPHLPYTVFRSQFDAWFAQEAVDAGAELFTATLVEDLLRDDGRVAGVRTRRGDLRARVVIGADGVMSTVAEKSGAIAPLLPTEVSLIVREVLDLPAKVIEDRFNLRSGEGQIALFYGLVSGANGNKGIYYTELYTNRDSLSLTAEVPLNVLQVCEVPVYDVLAARERHPYIARLIQGAILREYQAHLIPWGGVDDLSLLYGDGVLLAGDAGRFVTQDGVGSWPAMASGVAAARAVMHACDKGDFSERGLAIYRDLLEEEGLVQTQRDARRAWAGGPDVIEALAKRPERLFSAARRYHDRWLTTQNDHPYSPRGQIYHDLIKPLAPWYLRWPLRPFAFLDTFRWRRRRTRMSD
jgi:electron transfer flavoprotein-quinone oxidoreductase